MIAEEKRGGNLSMPRTDLDWYCSRNHPPKKCLHHWLKSRKWQNAIPMSGEEEKERPPPAKLQGRYDWVMAMGGLPRLGPGVRERSLALVHKSPQSIRHHVVADIKELIRREHPRSKDANHFFFPISIVWMSPNSRVFLDSRANRRSRSFAQD